MAVFTSATGGNIGSFGHKRRRTSWGSILGLIVLGMVILGGISHLQEPTSVRCNPPQCAVAPPRSSPIRSEHVYHSSAYGFSLQYSTKKIDPSNVTDHSISWDGTLSDGSEIQWSYIGTSARGRDAETLVNQVQNNNFSDATQIYSIPGADIGYTPGYGNVYDVITDSGAGLSERSRLIIMAAVKRGVAVVFLGLGPYQQSTPQNDGHPNPASTPLVKLGDLQETLKTVTWPGDPPL